RGERAVAVAVLNREVAGPDRADDVGMAVVIEIGDRKSAGDGKIIGMECGSELWGGGDGAERSAHRNQHHERGREWRRDPAREPLAQRGTSTMESHQEDLLRHADHITRRGSNSAMEFERSSGCDVFQTAVEPALRGVAQVLRSR